MEKFVQTLKLTESNPILVQPKIRNYHPIHD